MNTSQNDGDIPQSRWKTVLGFVFVLALVGYIFIFGFWGWGRYLAGKKLSALYIVAMLLLIIVMRLLDIFVAREVRRRENEN